MKRIRFPRLTSIVAAALTVALIPGVAAAAVNSPEEGTDMLSRAEALAREIREQTGVMQTYVRFPTSYSNESHERQLVTIKEDVNDLGEIIQQLHQSRKNLEEWQAELVTRLLPRMKILTDNVGNAIRFIENNPERAFKPVYEDYVDRAYDQADSVVQSVDRYLTWAEAKSAMEAQKMVSQTR